jgi:hypothetical protein
MPFGRRSKQASRHRELPESSECKKGISERRVESLSEVKMAGRDQGDE